MIIEPVVMTFFCLQRASLYKYTNASFVLKATWNKLKVTVKSQDFTGRKLIWRKYIFRVAHFKTPLFLIIDNV